MTDLNRIDSTNLDAFVASAGTQVAANRLGAYTSWGVTLANSTTYYVPFGSGKAPVPREAPLVGLGVQWASVVVATVTIEISPWPATSLGHDPRGTQVTDFSTSAAEWVQINPTSPAPYIAISAGATASGLGFATGGAAAGLAWIDLGNVAAPRCRYKVVVTTGGLMRFAVHGKAAA